MNAIGNVELLKYPKSAFLCSDNYSSRSVLLSYDWATKIKGQNRCVISGFQSKLEKDVLEILLRGNSPIILVLARCIYKKCPKQYLEAVNKGQLLIISAFDDNVPITTRERAKHRNLIVMDYADDIVIGHIAKGGMLDSLLMDKKKPTVFLEN